MVSNRNLLFQGFIFRFHVSFPGCTSKFQMFSSTSILTKSCIQAFQPIWKLRSLNDSSQVQPTPTTSPANKTLANFFPSTCWDLFQIFGKQDVYEPNFGTLFGWFPLYHFDILLAATCRFNVTTCNSERTPHREFGFLSNKLALPRDWSLTMLEPLGAQAFSQI